MWPGGANTKRDLHSALTCAMTTVSTKKKKVSTKKKKKNMSTKKKKKTKKKRRWAVRNGPSRDWTVLSHHSGRRRWERFCCYCYCCCEWKWKLSIAQDCFACEQIAFTTKQTNRGCRYESTKGIDVWVIFIDKLQKMHFDYKNEM